MAEGANAQDTPVDEAEPQVPTVEEYKRVLAQLKGEQRTNSRLRKQTESSLKAEAGFAKIDLLAETVTQLTEIVAEQSLSEDDKEAVKSVRRRVEQSGKDLEAQEAALSKISTLEGEADVAWDDPENSAAQALWDARLYDKAAEVYEQLAKPKTNDAAVEARAKEMVEEQLKLKFGDIEPTPAAANVAPRKGLQADVDAWNALTPASPVSERLELAGRLFQREE